MFISNSNPRIFLATKDKWRLRNFTKRERERERERKKNRKKERKQERKKEIKKEREGVTDS